MNPKHVLYISIDEDRGKAATRYLIKPPVLDDSNCWYTPSVSTEEPITVWEEEEMKLLEEEKTRHKDEEKPVQDEINKSKVPESKKGTNQKGATSQRQANGNKGQRQKKGNNQPQRAKQKKQSELPNIGEI